MSEQYLVSARKYRPQTFDTVVGQEHVTTTLKNAIRNQHLAHAYLFCGPRGVGKTTCARILARTINCENPTPDIEACGECATCKSFNENTSFNVFELDAASNNSVEDIRELVNQVRFAPQQGRYKIYIIDEVHMLSSSAFNAFLKTLEEPPPYAIFILATTEKHKILPTILSRCQIFDFKRITTSDTVHHLEAIASKEGLQAEEAALHVIAQKSEGCMRDSLSMLDRIASFTGGSITYAATMEHLALLDADFYFYLTDAMLAQDVSSVLLKLDGVLAKGFEGNVVLEGLAEHFRNLLLCKDSRMAKMLDVPAGHRKLFFEKAAQAPPSFILSAMNVLNESEMSYREATNKRLHTELCLIRLCYLLQATNATPQLPAEEIKKNSTDEIVKSAPVISPVTHTPTTTIQQEQPQVLPQNPVSNFVAEPNSTMKTATANQESTMPPVNTRPTQQPEGRRISASILLDIDNDLQAASAEIKAIKVLSQNEADRMFKTFLEKVRTEGRSVLYSQMLQMQARCVADDEIRIFSPTEMADSYAQSLRPELITYFTNESGIAVRVTTELDRDESREEDVPKVLSKIEVYEAMKQKNPFIGDLKEGLGLQIDY